MVIARDGTSIARLVPVAAEDLRPVGFLSGSVPESFLEPLPEDELRAWE